MSVVDPDRAWPTDKLTALRLGRRLVAEVPSSAPRRRSFITIRPETEDAAARSEGWNRTCGSRSFLVDHWEYDEERLDTWDYDIGAVHVSRERAEDEAALDQVLARRGLAPAAFDCPWRTADPT
jgi:hypothetical protein